jgi:ribose 5-phosphate isomerase A
MAFGLAGTLARLGDVTLRAVPPSPDGGVIADYHGPVGDPAELAIRLSTTPGVVDHGLFGPWMVSEVVVGEVVDGDQGRAYWLERTSSASTRPSTQGAPR